MSIYYNNHRYIVGVIGELDDDISPYIWIRSFILRNDYYVYYYSQNLDVEISTSSGILSLSLLPLNTDTSIRLDHVNIVVVLHKRESSIQDIQSMIEKVGKLGCRHTCIVSNGSDRETITYTSRSVIDSSRQKGIGGFTLLCRILISEDDLTLKVRPSRQECLLL